MILERLFGKKADKHPPLECRITGVRDIDGGWAIEYESVDGQQFESGIYRTYLNGSVRPRPEVGQAIIRQFSPGGDFFPPRHILYIGDNWFKHYPVGNVEGII